MNKMEDFAEFKKIKVGYTDEGKGRVIVLLHGFLGSRKMWDVYVKALSKNFRVIAIDLPGHGVTPSIGYYHSMEMLAQSVKAVLDKIGVRKYIIAGHSMGGYTTLAFAELFPENISGICLVHSTGYADSEEKIKERNKVIRVVKGNHKQFIIDMITSHFSAESIEKKSDKIKMATDIAISTSRKSIISSLEGMKERKSRELILKFAEFPVLFIVGKKDSIIDYNSIFSLIGKCKYPSVLMMENYGHMGFIESPKEPLREIELFAKRCFNNQFS